MRKLKEEVDKYLLLQAGIEKQDGTAGRLQKDTEKFVQ